MHTFKKVNLATFHEIVNNMNYTQGGGGRGEAMPDFFFNETMMYK